MMWYSMVWFGMVWDGIMVCYGMVWYGMVWYGMMWYSMLWYGICVLLRLNGCETSIPEKRLPPGRALGSGIRVETYYLGLIFPTHI